MGRQRALDVRRLFVSSPRATVTGVIPHVMGAMPRRSLCASADAHAILGLPANAARSDIKKAFYALAKQTHPDVIGASSLRAEDDAAGSCSSEGQAAAAAAAAATSDGVTGGSRSFLEIHAAFELLMHLDDTRARGGAAATSASHAARGGTAAGGASRARRPGARVTEPRERSLGEMLCDRLDDEPWAVMEVWEELLREQLRITEPALEAIFRACGSKDTLTERGGGGLPTALSILRDATLKNLLTTQTREAAVIFIIKWCKEDSSSFAKIMAELEESDKTPQVRDNLAYANALYSGYSDGYSA